VRNYSVVIASSLISALFILLTGWISFSYAQSVLFEITFIFHLIPFGIGFAEGTSVWIYIYYLVLWICLSCLFSPLVIAYQESRNKRRFLSVAIAPVIAVLIISFSIDYFNNVSREQRIAERKMRDTVEFGYLRTGDLLFNKLSGDLQVGMENGLNRSFDNIGIVFIDGDNYGVMETAERVGYISMSSWIEKGLDQKYVVKRLFNDDSVLTDERIQKLRKEAHSHIWKEVEKSRNWSDDKLYNAELVWKVFKNSLDVELAELNTVNDEFSSEYVITPEAIYSSKSLVTVRRE